MNGIYCKTKLKKGVEIMNNEVSLTKDYMLEQGIVMLVGEIDTYVAQNIISQLQYLATKYPSREIQLWINSPGGSVSAGMSIYDTINYIKVPVQTLVIGMAASMGAFLLSSGSRGKRVALENAEILIHQPLGGAQGQASDIIIAAQHIEKTRTRLNYILAKNTDKSIDVIERDTDRDYIMTAKEALAYGLIDKIIETTPKAWKSEKGEQRI